MVVVLSECTWRIAWTSSLTYWRSLFTGFTEVLKCWKRAYAISYFYIQAIYTYARRSKISTNNTQITLLKVGFLQRLRDFRIFERRTKWKSMLYLMVCTLICIPDEWYSWSLSDGTFWARSLSTVWRLNLDSRTGTQLYYEICSLILFHSYRICFSNACTINRIILAIQQ